jgi:crotonobetainyl-CoA:carnitine CoA-transferase CaiB-like acyl-CoA transferase
LRFKGADKLGLSEDELRGHNPNIVFSYVSAYGQRGKRGNFPGFDTIFTALAGWEHENAGIGNPPLFVRHGPMDVLSAQTCFVGTLASLYAQRAHGKALTMQGSLLGAAVLTQGEILIQEDGTLSAIDRLDAAQTGLSPYHRIFETRDGQWIAVAAKTPAHHAVMRELLGEDPEGFAAAVREQDARALLDKLQDRGVPSDAVVIDDAMNRFFDSRINLESGLVWALPQPDYGIIEQPGAFWNFVDVPMKPRYASPAIGQHTDEILEILGFKEAEVEELKASKIVS